MVDRYCVDTKYFLKYIVEINIRKFYIYEEVLNYYLQMF